MIMDGISVEEFAEIRAEEAYAKGEQAAILETARKMKAKGMPSDVIKEITGLSPEDYQ